MKVLLKIFLCVFVLSNVQAQEKSIYGKVFNASKTPLPGVNVYVKNKNKGVSTDFDGKYQIKATSTDTLVFSYIGFITKQISVRKRNVIEVTLIEDSSQLDEVVVIGYGTQKRSTVTGSISTVKAHSVSKTQLKRQKKIAYHNKLASQIQGGTVSKVLQGKVSGVQVASKKETRIMIRGAATFNKNQTQPLVIVDGKISSIKTVDLNNIASINVLKDARATHIYGNKGRHGVILIATKNIAKKKEEDILYIVDGVPVKKELNYIIEDLPKADIDSKTEYQGKDAKSKFGKIAKNGCIVITTHQGNFRLNNEDSYAIIDENAFERTTLSPLSTFSIDVDKASYSNIRRMINNGNRVEPDAVKIEEMINYFDYKYPQPTKEHPFSIDTEVARTPWHQDTKIIKIGLQGKTYKNEELPETNLTFLIDVSGSMSAQNKLPLLKSAFKVLVKQLREKDKVAIVVYAGAAGVVLEPTSGKYKDKIIDALNNLKSGGSTAGGAGIQLAYKLAEKHFKKNGNNRVILATDGDFNVGAYSDKDMIKLIEEKRKSGVFLSVLGFGYGNYKDSKLEALADKGNGNHAYIDNMLEAQKVFGKEFGGTLYTIAKDVKIQVEFNPNKVQAYRLIGYENRMLEDEDFIDDTKDAGELGSGHTVTALYEVIPVGISSKYLKDIDDLKYTKAKISPIFSEELFTVKFRYKKPDGTKSIEMVHIQKDEVKDASEDLKFASAVALFGMQLRHSKYHNNASIQDVLDLAEAGRGEDKNGYRAEFKRLVSSYQNL